MSKQGSFYLIKDYGKIERTFDYIAKEVKEIIAGGGRAQIKVSKHEGKRTLSANNLYWQWLTVLAKFCSTEKTPLDKDTMHDVMRHMFLGYNDQYSVGKQTIRMQLKSTAKLNKSEMCHYMSQIDAWAVEKGCLLPRPEDSEYQHWADMQKQ